MPCAVPFPTSSFEMSSLYDPCRLMINLGVDRFCELFASELAGRKCEDMFP